MNKPINWEEWGKEMESRLVQENLKKSKSGSISYLESQGNYVSRKEIFHAHWETYLTSSDYWKNWRGKINDFQTNKEVNFYTDRLRAFIEFVEKYTCKDKNNYRGTFFENLQQWDPTKTPQLIEQELNRLENISEEEFNKTDKWRKEGSVFKELSAQEILNDPWFNKEIDKFFGLNGKSGVENNVVYTNGKKDIQRTKKLLETLKERAVLSSDAIKADETLTSSEKQKKLQQNQARLDYLNDRLVDYNSNSLTSSFFIGGEVLLSIVGLVSFLLIRKTKKNK